MRHAVVKHLVDVPPRRIACWLRRRMAWRSTSYQVTVAKSLGLLCLSKVQECSEMELHGMVDGPVFVLLLPVSNLETDEIVALKLTRRVMGSKPLTAEGGHRVVEEFYATGYESKKKGHPRPLHKTGLNLRGRLDRQEGS